MILYEYEGKELLATAGLVVPRSQLLNQPNSRSEISTPSVLKAQILAGKRSDSGGIIKVFTKEEYKIALKKLFGLTIKGERVSRVLVEELIKPISLEYYLSFSYDSLSRQPVLTFSSRGGSGIEERDRKMHPINILNPIWPSLPMPVDVLKRLFNLFLSEDCLLLEINPLVETKQGFIALDAKIKLDDTALGRHRWRFKPRTTVGRIPTERELAAKEIDRGDHRGTAGSAYLDLDGDIAVLASGGGASLVAMDALIAAGGRPANYTEYSGNPSREKVKRLTEIVLSKPDLRGLWIVGAVANFTDIYETLAGVIEGLRHAQKSLDRKFYFPIVVRRGGPREQEAFAMLKSASDFDLHVFGSEMSIGQSAQIMVKLSDSYRCGIKTQ